ncbi:SURF1 family protein [Sphingomonas changnyeongensis]|uniref:SURF1-like protein n=1 Tax=Sphingomonas changnyeongensis TaxID=2698679 RepID=A0A7Z2NY12_9SPHN|nr:SURF1 family protein [Sphingomonas changnyeongensis]QHL91867.1 SURF1 family protein [Sphingomonas changnyeongensis]
MLAGLGLGVWQFKRMVWKHALIAQVEARLRADPVAAPGPASWPAISAGKDAYRRVTLSGRFRHDRETLVQAVTERGGGYWVLTPLEAPGFTVIVNRGFVPAGARDPARRRAGNRAGPITVTGLLRLSEPGGGFLRANDPARDRWHSRDVAAIATRRRLGPVAPYFIDADAAPNPGGLPVGGMTVVRFADNHLVYALTWLALAAGCGLGAVLLWRRR